VESTRRIRSVMFGAGIAAFAAVLFFSRADAFSLSFKDHLATVAEGPGGRIAVHDLDLDGDDELIVFGSSDPVSHVVLRKFSASERAWKDIGQLNFEQPGVFFERALTDVTGDGYPDFIVAWRALDETWWVDAYANLYGKSPQGRFLRLGPFLKGCSKEVENSVGQVWVMGCFDLHNDGNMEVIVFSYPYARGTRPRQLTAFDASTGAELWSHDTAVAVSDVACVTERDSGERCLLVASYAPDNGFEVDGTTDKKSYVFCLSSRGELKWRMGFGSPGSSVYFAVADLDGDGKQDLVVSRYRGDDPGEANSPNLLRMNPATGEVLQSATLRASLRQCWCSKTRDGKALIICTGADATLYCFDNAFHMHWETSGTPMLENIVGVEDLDNDGDREILARSAFDAFILDNSGRIRAEAPARATIERAAIAVVGERRLPVLAAGGVIQFLQLRRPDVTPIGFSATVGGFAALMIAVVAWMRNRGGRAIRVSDRSTELLDAMVAFGHAGGSLRVIDRLRFHLQNWKRWADANSPSTTTFAELCDAYTKSVVPDLLNVASLARRTGVTRDAWKSLEENAQRAVDDIKSLLSGSQIEDRVGRATSQLIEVDRCLQEIRAHLRRIFNTPLEPLLEQVLARRRTDIEAAGTTVSVVGLSERYPSVFISNVALEKILDGLVGNALYAMAGSSKRSLTVDVNIEGDHYTVDVRDTGCGIAEGDWERIFERHYTTKEGGGFGLYYARHELARFGGKIYVLKSVVGEGTTMRVVLRSV
jgi:signal transduction histidine kinase